MSDDAPSTAPVDAPAPAAAPETTETAQPETEAPITKEDQETAGKVATTEATAPDGEKPAEAAEGPSEPAADGTPVTNGKDKKRKSTGGVPEHKAKKLNKKKSMPNLNLECKPGDYYWARLKGYPPWPSIICDEAMLPESLLASRPVSTTRPDGTLRDDFKEGGKNAKERTFPVMFLATNEFTWLVNTGLTPLDPADCASRVTAKMTKSLQSAHQIAAEGHDLEYFKKVLLDFQEESARIEEEYAAKQEEAEAKAAAKAEKSAEEAEVKEKKKKSRKSKSAVDDEDVEMEDAEAPKSSKKRKKEADSDGESAKPKKTPKVTKINAPKTPNGETASTKKAPASKPKKKVTAPKAEEETAEVRKELTEEEKLDAREKAILYLRHRLQKGFLSRETAPKEDEMAAMAEFFSQLEKYEELEPAIIRTTKIHKVLKAIVKLAVIPKDEEYHFKSRSAHMLEIWNKLMEADGDAAPKSAVEKTPATNGDAPSARATEEAAETTEGVEKIEEAADKVADAIEDKLEKPAASEEPKTDAVLEPPEAPVEKTNPGNEAQDEAADGDVSMMTAPEEPAAEA